MHKRRCVAHYRVTPMPSLVSGTLNNQMHECNAASWRALGAKLSDEFELHPMDDNQHRRALSREVARPDRTGPELGTDGKEQFRRSGRGCFRVSGQGHRNEVKHTGVAKKGTNWKDIQEVGLTALGNREM